MAALLLEFADGVYAFQVRAGEIRELEEKTDQGPYELYRRLLTGGWRMVDVTETIRLALMGGGEGWVGAVLEDGVPTEGQHVPMTAALALRLVARYVQTYGAPEFDPDDPTSAMLGPQPWAASALLGAQVLGAGLMGRSREELGKKPAGEGTTETPSPTAESDGLQSSPASQIAE